MKIRRHIQPVYNIATTICLDVIFIQFIRRIVCLKSVLFLSGFVLKILDHEMKSETMCYTQPPFFFRLWSSVHLLAHHIASQILTMIDVQKSLWLAKSENLVNIYACCSWKLIFNDECLVYPVYTQFGLSSKYSYYKIWTNPYFINLISNRANFAVRGPTSLSKWICLLFMQINC